MNLTLSLPPLQTSRLVLRGFKDTDFDAYAAYHCSPEVYGFLYTDAPTGDGLRAQFATVLNAPFINDGDTRRLAVVRKDDEALVGEVLLKIANAAALQLEVGYIFNPLYAGHGYATEAVGAMLNWGFESLGAHFCAA